MLPLLSGLRRVGEGVPVRSMKKSAILLAMAGLLLGGAIGLVIYGETQVPEPRFTSTLREILPPAPAGWTKTEKPIADTPEMQRAVGELLNFDDGIFVDYTNAAGDRLSVYIAYWTPGRMSHRLVAGHTPDVCWVGGGWQRTAMSRTDTLEVARANGSAVVVPAGESRTFVANGNPEHVWFWHLVGEESKSYGTGGTAPWHAAVSDILRKGLNQREEQFFIRLSSSKPVVQFVGEAVLEDVLARIPWPVQGSDLL